MQQYCIRLFRTTLQQSGLIVRSSLLQVVPTTWKKQLKQYLLTAREHTCYYLFADLLQLVRLSRVYITRFCIGQCMGFKQLIKIIRLHL